MGLFLTEINMQGAPIRKQEKPPGSNQAHLIC